MREEKLEDAEEQLILKAIDRISIMLDSPSNEVVQSGIYAYGNIAQALLVRAQRPKE